MNPDLPDASQLLPLCIDAACIHRGPLNHGYQVDTGTATVFVRRRVIQDERYGQTFAAERFLQPAQTGRLNVPRLVSYSEEPPVVALQWIDGLPPDWSGPALKRLASALATLHETRGPGYGDISATPVQAKAPQFLWHLFQTELKRAPRTSWAVNRVRLRTRRVRAMFDVFAAEGPRLIHGDVHGGNFLEDPGGKLWMLDWEAARYRVPASDFNQTHTGWLTPEQDAALLAEYCTLTGRDFGSFRRQVLLLRALWHLRTFNFLSLVLKASDQDDGHHLRDTYQCLSDAATERRRPAQ